MPFSTKMHSSYNKSYKVEYKASVMVFFIIVLTVHKYEESNVDFNLFTKLLQTWQLCYVTC